MQLYQPTITGSLAVSGSVTINGPMTVVSGSLSGTASLATTASYAVVATSASYAASSSFASAFTVAGTLTAQTLVVQTITSSVDFVTGSTQFGSLLSNTHVFSGSVTMNPGGLFVSSSGNVGIGTITPTVNGSGGIQIYGSSQRTLRITGNSNNANSLEIGCDSSKFAFIQSVGAADRGINFYTGDASNLLMTLTGSNVGIGTTNPVTALNVVAGTAGSSGRIRLTHATSAAQIDLYTGVSDGIGIIVNNNPLWFEVSGSEKMRITSGGNVGIGTTNPSFLLDVNDTSASGVRGLRISTSSSTVGPGLFLYINSGAQTNWAIGNSYEVGNALEFRSSNSVGGNPGSAGTTRMLITNGGNVGIGTSSPNGLLSIRASLSDTPALRFQNNITSGLDAALSTYVSSTQTYLAIGTNCYINSTGNIARFNTSYESSFIAFDEGTLRFSTGTTSANPITKLIVAPSGKITLDQSTYFVCGTTGFRFNNSTDAFNNFVALDNGNATLRGTLTQNSSDERLKNNIQIIPNALNKISQLRGVTFEWNKEIYDTSRTTDIGVIAQDVQSVLPDAVTLAPFDTNFETNTSKSGENYLTVYYEKLIPLLVEGIKELKAEFDEYKATHP